MRRRVIAAEVTTTIRHNAATVELGRRDGMPEACVVNCDNLVTVNQDDLVELLTTLSITRMLQVDRSLQFALRLD